MHNLIALAHREWQEHRNTFIFPPAIILALIVIAVLFGVTLGEKLEFEINRDGDRGASPSTFQQIERRPNPGLIMVSAQQADFYAQPRAMFAAQRNSASTLDELASADVGKLPRILDELTFPFTLVLILVSLAVAISVTYDERKDRSLLFWKSMPVDDVETIISKFVFVCWIAPLATVVAIVIARLLLAGVASVYSNELALGEVWGNAQVWRGFMGVISGFLLLGLWVAPIYAWLMLVGAVVTRSPMLIATITPLVLMWLEWLFFDSTYLLSFATSHISPRTLYSGSAGFTGQLELLLSPGFGVGLAVAALLLVMTVYARKRFNEI
jgi:ABC-2 family transporter protein/PGF-CTERM motif